MCGICGCADNQGATLLNLQTGETSTVSSHAHAHEHGHSHGTAHIHAHEHHDDDPAHRHDHHHHNDHHRHHHHDAHAHGHGVTVDLEARILAKNDALAAKNRAWFAGREILALNLVSSPGAGKTALLERTIRDLKDELALCVIEGDQATAADGERIRAAGAAAVQVNTGTGCHLEADMIAQAVKALKPAPNSVLLIENVGNLVCPALFDLGERAKVAILSVTEGEDKPLKYPHMFRAAALLLMNKTDLLPHVDFDMDKAIAHAREVNPEIEVLQISARSGAGLEAWYGWLRRELDLAKQAVFA